ncbi:MAG: hypothetical protein J6Y08_07130 [Clostridiales bacterium]|nr:hypothetical protein [Clostridiales bacterium]
MDISNLNVQTDKDPNKATEAAVEEGRRIAADPNVPGYKDMASLRSALDE